MAKKDFKGMDSLLGGTTENTAKKKTEPESKKSSRATFFVDNELQDKVKAIAYWERTTIKEIVNTALLDAVKKYERKNGSVEPIPDK